MGIRGLIVVAILAAGCSDSPLAPTSARVMVPQALASSPAPLAIGVQPTEDGPDWLPCPNEIPGRRPNPDDIAWPPLPAPPTTDETPRMDPDLQPYDHDRAVRQPVDTVRDTDRLGTIVNPCPDGTIIDTTLPPAIPVVVTPQPIVVSDPAPAAAYIGTRTLSIVLRGYQGGIARVRVRGTLVDETCDYSHEFGCTITAITGTYLTAYPTWADGAARPTWSGHPRCSDVVTDGVLTLNLTLDLECVLTFAAPSVSILRDPSTVPPSTARVVPNPSLPPPPPPMRELGACVPSVWLTAGGSVPIDWTVVLWGVPIVEALAGGDTVADDLRQWGAAAWASARSYDGLPYTEDQIEADVAAALASGDEGRMSELVQQYNRDIIGLPCPLSGGGVVA